MNFIRKLLGQDKDKRETEARGTAPLQSQEEQDATRARMEAEMDEQREHREQRESDRNNP